MNTSLVACLGRPARHAGPRRPRAAARPAHRGSGQALGRDVDAHRLVSAVAATIVTVTVTDSTLVL